MRWLFPFVSLLVVYVCWVFVTLDPYVLGWYQGERAMFLLCNVCLLPLWPIWFELFTKERR